MILYVTIILVLAIISLWISLLNINQFISLELTSLLGDANTKRHEMLAVYDKGSVERAVGFGQFLWKKGITTIANPKSQYL